MDPKNFLEAIVIGEQEQAADSFSTLMQNKLSDALEVKKVEVASGIFGEVDEARKISRAEWRIGTQSEVDRNNKKIYTKLLASDPEKAKRFHDNLMQMKNKSAKNEEVEQVDEVLEGGSAADNAKQMNLHKTNLQKMQMDPLERSKIMSALKSRVAGKRLNMQQNVALTGYLERAGGLSNVSAAVRNKALKQQ